VLILDLQWMIFGCLLVIVMAVALLGQGQPGRRSRGALLDQVALAAGLDQAPFGVLVLDGSRACRYANPHARRLLGLAPPARCLPDAPWVELLDADRRAVRHNGGGLGRSRTVPFSSWPADAVCPATPSHRVVRWWVTPLAAGELVLVMDVTSHYQAEEAMRSLVNDLSHELRTPLATVLTHLEVLNLAHISDDIRQQSMGLIRGEMQRMVRLLHQMLELGRLETTVELDQRPVDVLALAEETVAQLGPQAEERNIILSLEVDTPLPAIVGDEDRLRQVFLNLVDNALKYSRPGDAVVISLVCEAQGIRCTIQDSGPGISAEHLAHVTRRFYRAAPQEAAGSGLGLTLVDEILRHHQSVLEIESRVDGELSGTCVRFLLPTTPEPR
jgi:two-component system phosphate regulon sensor histidine kinase PhoR